MTTLTSGTDLGTEAILGAALAASQSLVYRSGLGYSLAMRLLYGRHYGARHRAIAELVAPHSTVLELCCGPGTLYLGHLRDRVDGYLGLDLNERFVQRLRARGVAAERWDLAADRPLPVADFVLKQASLYHFLPEPRPVVDRMRAAARREVVISEPVRNLATSRVAPVARLAARGTSPGDRHHAERFTDASLEALMAGYGEAVRRSLLLPGGRERVYVLAGA